MLENDFKHRRDLCLMLNQSLASWQTVWYWFPDLFQTYLYQYFGFLTKEWEVRWDAAIYLFFISAGGKPVTTKTIKKCFPSVTQ